LNAKIGDAQIRRKIALEGHRFSPQEALAAGIVDHIVSGDTAAVLAKAEELGLTVGVKAQGLYSIEFYFRFPILTSSLTRRGLGPHQSTYFTAMKS
jgi:enoyl-CoA hydratase/carnithine racemase